MVDEESEEVPGFGAELTVSINRSASSRIRPHSNAFFASLSSLGNDAPASFDALDRIVAM